MVFVNKRIKNILNLIVLILVAHAVKAQPIELNDSIESFGTQVAIFLELTNNSEASAIGQDFETM